MSMPNEKMSTADNAAIIEDLKFKIVLQNLPTKRPGRSPG